jgi:hypothetical protein
MRADLLQEAIQFLHEWRERIVAQLEQGAFPIRRHERNHSRSTRSNSHGDIMMHDEDSEAENMGQRRLTQVFKFLKELNELRNPVPRDMSAYTTVLRIDTWPVHPFVEVRRGDRAEEDDDVDGEGKLEPIIRIRRAGLTSCPTPPEVLDGWLKPGWQMVEAEIEIVASRNFGTGSVLWERFCLLQSSLMPFESGKFPAQIAAFLAGLKRLRELLGW